MLYHSSVPRGGVSTEEGRNVAARRVVDGALILQSYWTAALGTVAASQGPSLCPCCNPYLSSRSPCLNLPTLRAVLSDVRGIRRLEDGFRPLARICGDIGILVSRYGLVGIEDWGV